jgi:hypothetical protein
MNSEFARQWMAIGLGLALVLILSGQPDDSVVRDEQTAQPSDQAP